MRLQRFFLTPESIDLSAGVVSIRERALINQIKVVLRLKQGDAICVLDGCGSSYDCVLASLETKEIRARIRQANKAGGDPPLSTVVALPLLKGGRFEWALQKLTELGVTFILPFTTALSVVKAVNKFAGRSQGINEGDKVTRWRAIAREAAEQCERATVPEVGEPVSFSEAISRLAAANDIGFICTERSQAPLLSDFLHTLGSTAVPPQRISLLVGPEGGFTNGEVEYSLDCGLKAVSLGPRILRSETAAIFSLAQVMAILGDA